MSNIAFSFIVGIILISPLIYYVFKKRQKKTEYYFLRNENGICQKCRQEKKKLCNFETCSFVLATKIFGYISGAKKTLEMASPSFTHPIISDAIFKANSQNVRIKIITSRVEHLMKFCVRGIVVKGLDCPKGCLLFHNKFIIIDGEVMIRSSLNYTPHFLQGNSENLQIIFDKKKIAWYRAYFDDLWSCKYQCLLCNKRDEAITVDTGIRLCDSEQTARFDMTVPSVRLNNGRFMPSLGLGTWLAAPGEVGKAVRLAIDAGYRHIDCALLYQNEQEIGEAIREKIDEGVVKRSDLFITSKLWNTYHRPDLVIKGCKKTLKNFGLEYIDMYLIHWPFGFKATDKADAPSKELGTKNDIMSDPEFMPRGDNGELIFSDDDYVDTWKEMEKCVQLGLTKSIGVSNFNVEQLKRLIATGNIPPATNQIEVHPYLTQKEIRDFCHSRGIIVTGYCPLGSARDDLDYVRVLDHPKVLNIAETLGKSAGQVVLRYLVQLDVVPIPKSTNPDRLSSNISVFDFELSQAQVAELASLDSNKRTCSMIGTEAHKFYPF